MFYTFSILHLLVTVIAYLIFGSSEVCLHVMCDVPILEIDSDQSFLAILYIHQ